MITCFLVFLFNLLNITCTYIQIGHTPLDKYTVFFCFKHILLFTK